MISYSRSDLACENLREGSNALKGATEDRRRVGRFEIHSLILNTGEASKSLGKPMGRYLTVECGPITRLSEREESLLEGLLCGELRGMARRLTQKEINGDFSVLIAGLGNAELTADALGPGVVRRLTATRHLRTHEGQLYRMLGCASVATLAPGVLGQTGIETLELLQGAVGCIRPDIVVVVDALAAGSCERLASTVQITDAGIAPGSGVGNRRERIDAVSLGVPVLSMGVPTVVDSSTLVWDALQKAGYQTVEDPLREVLENGRNFFVSPKECDLIVGKVVSLLSHALELAFVGDLSEE